MYFACWLDLSQYVVQLKKYSTGSIPLIFCSLTKLNTLSIWESGGSSTNPGMGCTLSCLSTKTGMHNAPATLRSCVPTEVPPSTQTALCDFIAATNVATIFSEWNCNTAHSVATEPCNGGAPLWSGITACSSSGDVTAINLGSTGLSGSIPTSIGYLTALTYLNICNNLLGSGNTSLLFLSASGWSCIATAGIPSSIGNLISLQYLMLCGNKLTGIDVLLVLRRNITSIVARHYSHFNGKASSAKAARDRGQ